MPAYTAKQALIDLGFIDGYLHETENLPRDWGMFEPLLDALQRIEEYAVEGHLKGRPPTASSYARFLHDLGFLRGLIWSHPISSAVSEAIGRVVAFTTESDDFPCCLLDGCGDRAEPAELCLSDEQRHVLTESAIAGEEVHTAGFAEKIGTSHHGVLEHWRKQGALTREEVAEELAMSSSSSTSQNPPEAETHLPHAPPKPLPVPPPSVPAVNPFNPSGKKGRREWTDEQRAEQAARAREHYRKKPPLIPDSDLESVKAQFEAGVSADRIAVKYRCSGSHVRNFLQKHGIDPRRGQSGPKPERQEPVAEASRPAEPAEPLLAAPDLAITTTSHADRWKPNPIDVAEWPDIQKMLASGSSREAIASDYDVPVEGLDEFIAERLRETQERHRQKAEVKSPPGESRALASAGVGSAA